MRSAILVLMGLILVACGPSKQVEIPARTNLDPQPITDTDLTFAADPQLGQQWALKKIGADEASLKSKGTRRVSVAVVGTGVDYTHEDLRGNMFVNRTELDAKLVGAPDAVDEVDQDKNKYTDDFVGYDFIDHDGLPYDRLGTGTAMAGVIGALAGNGKGIQGVSPNVSILPVRYIGRNGVTDVLTLVKALEYVAVMKADVVCLQLANLVFSSAAQTDPQSVHEVFNLEEGALTRAMQSLSQVPVIVSAGNSGTEPKGVGSVVRRLSQFPNVAVVTSVDAQDQKPFIANYGRSVVMTAAPGEKVLSTLPGNQYSPVDGTPIAAAHVAGAVALAVGENYGKKTAAELIRGLVAEAAGDPLPQLEPYTIGGNRLNVAKYLEALRK